MPLTAKSRSAALQDRIMRLLTVAREPLSLNEVWLILGGSSGKIHLALIKLLNAGKVTRRIDRVDGRTKYQMR